MRTGVVIVAAGGGTRMGGTPKQFRLLGGRSVLQRSVDAFLLPEIDRIVCVIGADQRAEYERAVSPDPRLLEPVRGGTTRQTSVLAGLRALRDVDVVLIHDAARPFVGADTVRAVIAAVAPGTGALPGLPVADTLARVRDGRHDGVVDRSALMAMQTPQGFRRDELLVLHERAAGEHTDDAGLARAGGLTVRVVPGDPGNRKLTTAEDFAMAERMIAPDVRVGHGYDTHRLVGGDGVWLCGVRLPHDRALDGHSDADVGLHALTDALLATIGAGDIGTHFPPSDPQWRGASSDRFLRHAADLVRARGGTVRHADVTLVCERPKIGPHVAAMRERMAKILAIEMERVSVKATTNEERGFVGREEGIVALATATVVL